MNTNIFPAINSEIAFYNPSNFKITFCELSTEEFFKINDDPKDLQSSIKRSIILHETRHYIDHIATLWGQKYMLKFGKAIDTRLSLDYLNYNKLVEYSIDSKRLFYKDYYSEIYSTNRFKMGDKPWLSKTVIAHKFDNDGNSAQSSPIIMFRFTKNDGTEEPIARVPLSIVSLLETNSTFEEIRTRAISISNQAEDVKLVEHINFNRELVCDLIYNQNLAVYNVAVHLAANVLNIVDIAKAIETSSIFATVALNMPSELLKKMYINPDNYLAWKNEIPFLIENFDYGFIFMNLLYNYKSFYNREIITVEDILDASKLGNYEQFNDSIVKESDQILNEIQSQNNFKRIFEEEFSKGRQLFDKLGVGFEKITISKAMYELKIIPHYEFSDTPLVLKDYDKNFLYKNIPHITEDFDEWAECSALIEDEITNFYEIRGL